MVNRKGLGKGLGSGYKNIIRGFDAKVHSNSAKGIKLPQKLGTIYSGNRKRQYNVYGDSRRSAVGGGKNTPEENKRIAGIIFQQLGGNKFRAMTGAKDFYFDENSIGFRIPRARDGINMVKITLNGKDLYDVEYFMARGEKIFPKGKQTDIYNDQLQEQFTAKTGLYTNLGGKGLTSAERHNKMMDKIFEKARNQPSSLNRYYWRKGKVVKRIK